MTKVEAQIEAPFWVRYGKEWWVCRYMEKRDVEDKKKGSELKRLWSKKVSSQRIKVVFYGSDQAAIVPMKSVKPFQENFLEFAKLAQNNDEVRAGLLTATLSVCPVKPRVEKVDCMHCHGPWSEEDLGPNSKVLVCEMCEEEFHFRCTRLKKIPKSIWICFSCREGFPVLWSQILAQGDISEIADAVASVKKESGSPGVEDKGKKLASSLTVKKTETKVKGKYKEMEKEKEKEGDEAKSVERGKKRKLGRQESSEGQARKASSSSSVVMGVDAIREALDVCYVPKVVSEKAKLSSWLDVDQNMWFLKLVAVANRSLKDNEKTAEILTAIVDMKEWKAQSSGTPKWIAFLERLHGELKELLKTVKAKPHSLRYVKFKINEIVEQILGYLAAKSELVEPVKDDSVVATDKLITDFMENQVHLLNDKSEFKATVVRLLKDAGIEDAKDAESSKLYYTVKAQLTNHGARWPQKKPKRLSRENVMMACSFYKGIRAFSVSEESRPHVNKEPVEPKVKEETKDSDSTSSPKRKTSNALESRKKPVVAVDSNVNDSQVKAEPSAKRIKVEEPTGSNAKEKGGQSSQLGTTTVKKEENQPKKPNLSEQLLAFAAAEEKLAKQKLVEPQALLAEPTYEVIPRERISFAEEEETWFSDKLAQRVRSVFDSAIQVKVEEEGKSATFCNSFQHCRELDLEAAKKEELIPILSEEHSEFAFMQPGPGWWGVVECGLEPCEDSDDDVAPKKKTFGV